MSDRDPSRPPALMRVVMTIVPLIFALIGLTVIIFVWGSSDGGFEPPLFFKIFASLIASVFIVVGASGAMAAATGKGPAAARFGQGLGRRRQQARAGPLTTACPQCGAILDGKAEISPSGDVKCASCGGWFNVRS